MSLITAVAAEAEHELAPMIADPIVFAIIMAAFFVVIAMVTFSYRDVANRHNDRVPAEDHRSEPGHH